MKKKFMLDESEPYIVEAGYPIPDWVSEAKSVDNQGRPIISRVEQPQMDTIVNPKIFKPPTSQIRIGPIGKKGEQNRNPESNLIQEQPFKRQINYQQEQQEPIQQYQLPVDIIPQDEPQLLPEPITKPIKFQVTGQQRRIIDRDQQKNQNQQAEQNPEQSVSPEQSNRNPNIQKKIRKLIGAIKLLTRKGNFMRSLRRTAQKICDENHYDTPRFTFEAVKELQELMEDTMLKLIEDAFISTNTHNTWLYGANLNVIMKLRNARWDKI